MKRPLALVGGLAATAGLLAGTLLSTPLAGASSHREAPMIAGDPYADLTDLYAFVSPDKPDFVTLIMNAIPYENPAGGPNFYQFDPKVRYQLHVAQAGHSEVLCLHVDPELPEVALHRLPGPPRGDAHLLVVVAGRAA